MKCFHHNQNYSIPKVQTISPLNTSTNISYNKQFLHCNHNEMAPKYPYHCNLNEMAPKYPYHCNHNEMAPNTHTTAISMRVYQYSILVPYHCNLNEMVPIFHTGTIPLQSQ